MAKHKITEKDFKEIKGWLEHCEEVQFIAEKTGISPQTIYRMRRAGTFEEYREIIVNGKHAAKPAEKPAKIGQITVEEVIRDNGQEADTAGRLGLIIGYLRDIAGMLNKMLAEYGGEGGAQA